LGDHSVRPDVLSAQDVLCVPDLPRGVPDGGSDADRQGEDPAEPGAHDEPTVELEWRGEERRFYHGPGESVDRGKVRSQCPMLPQCHVCLAPAFRILRWQLFPNSAVSGGVALRREARGACLWAEAPASGS